jgi:hypothetical protein
LKNRSIILLRPLMKAFNLKAALVQVTLAAKRALLLRR